MRIRDVLQTAIHNLWQRRLRTIFNLTGIVMGCVVLLMTAMNIHSELLKNSLLAGTLPDANDREGVLVNEFVAWQMGFRNDSDLPKLVGQPLTIEYQLAENRVANIYRLLTEQWNAMGIDEIQKQTQFLNTLLQLVPDLDSTSLSEEQKQQLRDLIGKGFQAAGAGSDPGAASEIEVTRTFIVRGIVYSGDDNPVASLFRRWFHNVREGLQIHPDVATEIYLSNPDRKWFYNATVMVEGSAHLRNVTDALRGQQFEPHSSLAVLEHIDFQIEQSGWVVYVIAVAILLTSARRKTVTKQGIDRLPGRMHTVREVSRQIDRLSRNQVEFFGSEFLRS